MIEDTLSDEPSEGTCQPGDILLVDIDDENQKLTFKKTEGEIPAPRIRESMAQVEDNFSLPPVPESGVPVQGSGLASSAE